MTSDADSTVDEEPPVPESVDDIDCPGCDTPPTRLQTRVVYADGEWWHVICAIRAHPQIVEATPRRCPECGTESEYRPLTREPEARSCPNCMDVFPAGAERDETVSIKELESP